MKLIHVRIFSAETCGGLLDGLSVQFRSLSSVDQGFDPLCLVGPNGSGKSQLLQVLAEVFQSTFHACLSEAERDDANPDLQFEIEYIIFSTTQKVPKHVRITRKANKQKKLQPIRIEIREGADWIVKTDALEIHDLLPYKVVGYTSGDNETLSLPFFVSRSGYAKDVREQANQKSIIEKEIHDTRLMLIDYSTHLEVLVANLLLAASEQRRELLKDARLERFQSFRCIIQLNHSAAPTGGVNLTEELKRYIGHLKRCATMSTFNEKKRILVLDFWINDATTLAFSRYWSSALELYSAFHKLAMLNDLVIPKKARERFIKDTKNRRFAARLPEAQDEDKVFRFERVTFIPIDGKKEVDYVSLSDGEHQLAQLLGTFCMLAHPNILFLLDEPESHFNPLWRVKFMSRLLELPTVNGSRRKDSDEVSNQDCLITTHSPFVPSDMRREKVLIFRRSKKRIEIARPDIQTYGATFDTIIQECFGIRPPISRKSGDEIDRLMRSNDAVEIRQGLEHLGQSVRSIFLAEKLAQLEAEEKK